MRKIKQWLKGGAVSALACVMLFAAAGCDTTSEKPDDKDPTPPGPSVPVVPDIKITVTASADKIAKDESVTCTASVENSDQGVTWSVSDPTVLRVTDAGVVTVLEEPAVDKYVSVIATSVEDSKVTSSYQIRVMAKRQEGTVGNLTAAMLEEVGNASITVSGIVTDYYFDSKQSYNNKKNYYDSIVKMEDGKWSGTWGARENETTPSTNLMTDIYVRGEEDNVKDENGKIGHAMERAYINKNNEVAKTAVKNYNSIPVIWEEQHLFNHLANIPFDDLTYDPADLTRYTYKLDDTDETSLYLMTYFSFSLTPMLDDTLQTVVLVVEDGKVTGIEMQSQTSYQGAMTDQAGNITSYDTMSYTTVQLSFSDIGTTTVVEPTPYEAPENADKLTAALHTMQAANNYTFQVEDVTTFAPSISDDDYSYESVTSSASSLAARVATPLATSTLDSARNYTSSVGTVGSRGWVTEDAIVISKTGKYSASLDDKIYHTEFSGYKQFDGYYEEFAYDSSVKNKAGEKVGALKGTRRVEGNIMDEMPTFEFSANVFQYVGKTTNNRYKFRLRESSIMRDIAMEVSSYSYASDASANSASSFDIVVDDEGHLISVTFPYSITFGTYLGYCTVNYSSLGETSIDMEKVFENYVERGLMDRWELYTMRYFRLTPNEQTHEENASVAITSIFGANIDKVPAPTTFMEIFGDNLSGPFGEDKTAKNANGDDVFYRWFSMTARSTEFDENAKVTNFEEIVEKADAAFAKVGLVKNRALTDITGGASGRSDRKLVYQNETVTVVIENNFTKNFWVYVYRTSDYNAMKAQ